MVSSLPLKGLAASSRSLAQSSRWTLPATISAASLVVVGAGTLAMLEMGALSALMAQHLLVMNVIAPLTAAALASRSPAWLERTPLLWGAALTQMVLLWGWHAPALQRLATGSAGLHLLMLALLAAAAILFWAALLRAGAEGRWSAVAALLITGKLACLLGGLLIFSPRELYQIPSLALSICAAGPSSLADQQLAGLMMIVACPLSYLVAGVVMSAQMLLEIEERPALAHWSHVR